jgi:hypothetical protein
MQKVVDSGGIAIADSPKRQRWRNDFFRGKSARFVRTGVFGLTFHLRDGGVVCGEEGFSHDAACGVESRIVDEELTDTCGSGGRSGDGAYDGMPTSFARSSW